MGYLDDILRYATGTGEYDPYRSEDSNGDNPILSEEQRKRILLGIHAPELYPSINDPNTSSAPSRRADLYGSPYPNIEGGEGPTGGGGGGAFDPGRRTPSIYEPGPNEAAYGEALKKPRPEYQSPAKLPWWKTAVEIALPSSRGIFGDPEKQAQQDYERRTGAYEGDIASKRGAASLEIGERDRQRRGILDEMKAERDANLYGRQMETQQKQGAYYEKQMNKPEKADALDYLNSGDPEKVSAATKYLELLHPGREGAANALDYLSSGDPAKISAAREYLRSMHPQKEPGGGAKPPDLKKSKIAATNRKNSALLKLDERATKEMMDPDEVRQQRQNIQDAFEQELEAAGHSVEHYEYPTQGEPAKPAAPPAQPGMMSRAVSAVGSMFGRGNAPAKPKLTPEQAAAELARRRGLTR